MQVDRSVVLMGMMGSGKTTIGTMLAERLGVPAVDNDTRISQITGRDNAEYLRSDPAAWRKIEAELVVETLSADEVVVFSLGGGAVAAPETAERLRSSNCTVVWLQADVDVLLERTATAPGTRPMLDGDAGERMRGLLAERTPIYQSLADVVVDATRSPDAIVENIVNALQQREVMS